MIYLIGQIFLLLAGAFLIGLGAGWWIGRRPAATGRSPSDRENQPVARGAGEPDAPPREAALEPTTLPAAPSVGVTAAAEAREPAAVWSAPAGETAAPPPEPVLTTMEPAVPSAGEAATDAGRAGRETPEFPITSIEGIGEAFCAKLHETGIRTTRDLLVRCADPAGRASVSAELGLNEAILLTWTCIADLMRVRGIGEEYSELVEAAGPRTVPELAACDTQAVFDRMAEIQVARKLDRPPPTLVQLASWKSRARELDAVIAF